MSLCHDAVVRTTLDISDEAYDIAKAIARDQNRSLGRVVNDLILRSVNAAKRGVPQDERLRVSDFPVRSARDNRRRQGSRRRVRITCSIPMS